MYSYWFKRSRTQTCLEHVSYRLHYRSVKIEEMIFIQVEREQSIFIALFNLHLPVQVEKLQLNPRMSVV